MSEPAQTTQFRIGEWLVTPALDQIERAGETVKLEPRMMRLLLRLSEAPGQVVSGQQLLDDVWAGVVVSPQSVYQAISQLRKLLGDVDEAPTYIATIPRKGYRLIARVEKAPHQVDASRNRRRTDVAQPSALPVAASNDGMSKRPTRPRVVLAALGFVLISALSYFMWIERTRVSDTRAATLVVMPFVDLTDGQKDAAFTEGLTEEVSTSLSQLPTLRIIARTSAYAVRDQKLDVKQIGRKLSASHIVEGTVRRADDSIRVTAQLIDAREGHRAWSETYNLSPGNVLRLQSDIGKAVARALDLRFSEEHSRRLRARNARSVEAYEMYLLGRHYYRQRTLADNTRAIELNNKAIALDPEFALAHVGLAQALLNEAILRDSAAKTVSAEVERHISAALAISPELADAYAVRGMLYRQLYEFGRARADLLEAVRIDPSNIAALAGLGVLEEYEGRPLNALGYYDRAAQLDPLDFLRHVRRCICLTDIGDYVQAQTACNEARNLKKDAAWVYLAESGIARAQGELARSLAKSDSGLAATPDSVELLIQRLDDLENLGLFDDAHLVISRVRTLQGGSAWADLSEAGVLLLEGKRDQAHRQVIGMKLDQRTSAVTLRHAGSLLLMMNDPAAAERMLRLAESAPDAKEVGSRNFASHRWGFSHLVTLASAEKMLGQEQRAKERMAFLLKQLLALENNGVRGWGIQALRADALAIMGDADGAVRSLQNAAALGWRRTYHTRLSPHFSSIRERPEAQELFARLDRVVLSERDRRLSDAAQLR